MRTLCQFWLCLIIAALDTSLMTRPLHYHLTKIVATLGPASDSLEMITSLAQAGVDVFRINFSHGSHEQHKEKIDFIRDIEKTLDKPFGIIADLQGPKLRVGSMPDDGVELIEGTSYTLNLEQELGDETSCALPHPEIFAAAEPNIDLLLDDGNLRLRATTVEATAIHTKVINGGILKSNKGVNFPDLQLPIPALTDKDKQDLAIALTHGADWIALSFVQNVQDLIDARKLIENRARLIAKIEKPQAVAGFAEILKHCDGVMIARGDLGVEMPPELVPQIQKRIVKQCRQVGCPVIVATQMLESMTHNSVPTRAEASDVATALYDGADAVMLSAESASGDYPVEAVEMMRRIIIGTEQDKQYRLDLMRDTVVLDDAANEAIVAAACKVAEVMHASAIVAFSQTGNTTGRASRQRPICPLLGLTPIVASARATTLLWGVYSIQTPDLVSLDEMVDKTVALAMKYGFAKKDDNLIITAGFPLGLPGRTNLLRLVRVGESDIK